MAKVAFLQNVWWAHLGQMSLSGALEKAGHASRAFLGDRRAIANHIRQFNPDIVAFSLLSGQQDFIAPMVSTCEQVLNRRPFVIVGGPLAAYSPEIIQDLPIDAVCRMEGEAPLVEVADQIDRGARPSGVSGLWIRRNGDFERTPPLGLADLDSLPFFRYELYADYPRLARNPMLYYTTSRGCIYNCAYCYNHAYRRLARGLGRPVRRQSVERTLEELAWRKRRDPFRAIYFQDDSFNHDQGWLAEFAEKYPARVGVPFVCNVQAASSDEETVRLLKAAGAARIIFGVECGDEQYRRRVLHKNVRDDDLRALVLHLRQYGLKYQTLNMLNLPGETAEQAWRTVRFNQEMRPDVAWFGIYQPYPGTDLFERAKRIGCLPAEFAFPDNLYHTASQLNQPDVKRIDNLHKFAALAVRFPILSPLLNWLTKLPPNKAFLALHRLVYIMLFWKKTRFLTFPELMKDAYIGWRYFKM